MIVDLSALELTWPVGRLTAVALQAEALAADAARLTGDHAALAAAMARTEELVATCARMMDVLCGQSGRAHPDALAWSAIGRAWAAHAQGAAEVDLWASAVEAAEAAGMRLVAADLRLWAAQAQLAAGTRAAAADLLAAALATARETGAHGITGRAEELIRRARLGPDPDASVDVSTRARLGLTDRELQVLRLLADGRTNREIGEALFMSPKTASVHVTNLLRKLDVPGRREAGRLARQLGLH